MTLPIAVLAASASLLPLTLTDPATGGPAVVDAKGARALHLVFLATWCEPCLDELEALADLEARWGAEEYRLILVAVPTRQDAGKLKTFLVRRAPPGKLVWDADGKAVRAFDVVDLPAHRVLDPDGNVVASGATIRNGVASAVDGLMRRRPARGNDR